MNFTKYLSLLMFLFSFSGLIAQSEVPKKIALPLPNQVQWQNMELSMFVHFAPNTWQGEERDNRSTPLNRINPAKLDVNQWIDAAELFGAKMIIFVAKHTGGFCMWQTASTEYSMKNTSYKGGKGDILDELAKACFDRGMQLGIYIYPGDDTWGAYGGSGGRTEDPTKQEGYNKVLRQQWEEVLSRYGNQIHEIWCDGGLIVPLEDIVKKYAPNAIVFQGPFANIRWVGNERGIMPYPAWNSVKLADAQTGIATGEHGNPEGEVWMPLEVDVPLKDHNWFWSPTNSKNLRNPDILMDIYYTSVGRGGVLLLNAAPDTTGLIPQEDMAIYRRFGKEIKRRFGKCVASTSGGGEAVQLNFGQSTKVDHVIIQEDVVFGQRVREYVVEGMIKGQWVELIRGTSIGYKKIDRFETSEVSSLRLRFLQYDYPPLIKNFSAYYVGKVDSNTNQPEVADKEDVNSGVLNLDQSGNFKIDLTDYIKIAGQYLLSIKDKKNKNLEIMLPNLILHGIEMPEFVKTRLDGSCNINITAHPTGEHASIALTGKIPSKKRSIGQKVNFSLKRNY